MNKLIILCGISNSGKSTFAATTVQHNPDRYVRVNRDKIREMLYGYSEENIKNYYYRNDLHKLETQVTEVENWLLYDSLKTLDKSVIVDATHLTVKYLNRFSEYTDDFYCNGAEIIFFNITLKEALTRNKGRARQVDEDVIIKQYENYINLRKFLTTGKLKFDYICTEINSEDE